MANQRHDSKRFLGLELSGAKNHKTVLAALEFYPTEKKIFLLDIFEKIAPANADTSADDALLDLIDELKDGVSRVGVNVPLQLPPCIECTKTNCVKASDCKTPSVKWMRDATRKAQKLRDRSVRALPFTPYTQRPVELWVRYQVMPKLPEASRFEIDETLGGNRAPLAARMHYLKKQLRAFDLVEVWPKLTVAVLAEELGLNKKIVAGYRHLEQGIHAREVILDALAEHHGIFIYERDIRKLSQNLGSFDAFICAYTALLSDTQRTVRAPAGFPLASGWVQYPIS